MNNFIYYLFIWSLLCLRYCTSVRSGKNSFLLSFLLANQILQFPSQRREANLWINRLFSILYTIFLPYQWQIRALSSVCRAVKIQLIGWLINYFEGGQGTKLKNQPKKQTNFSSKWNFQGKIFHTEGINVIVFPDRGRTEEKDLSSV